MNTKTITLTGEETAVKLDRTYPYIWVRNLGSGDVYMSLKPGIVPGADGVAVVPAGGGSCSGDVGQTNTLYLLGSGKIEVSPQFNAVCPFFKPMQKGGDSNPEILGEIMPYTAGITGYFDVSGVDLNGGKWNGKIGNSAMELSGFSVENDAVKFAPEGYGSLVVDEPEIIYIVFKKANPKGGEVIVGKGMTSAQYRYAFDLFSVNPIDAGYTLEFSKSGTPYIHSNVDIGQYHAAVMVRNFDFNSNSDDFASLYIDRELVGITSNLSKGDYAGKMLINRTIRTNGFKYIGTSDMYVKMFAVGAAQSVSDIVKNSEYLIKKFI